MVINISSDAAINAYPSWGAYGAAEAALRHMTAIWAEEAKDDGVKFLSLDPGDMDTPLHALAVPDADPAALKRPEDAAQEIVASMLERLVIAPRSRWRRAMTAAIGSIGSSPSSSSPMRTARSRICPASPWPPYSSRATWSSPTTRRRCPRACTASTALPANQSRRGSPAGSLFGIPALCGGRLRRRRLSHADRGPPSASAAFGG